MTVALIIPRRAPVTDEATRWSQSLNYVCTEWYACDFDDSTKREEGCEMKSDLRRLRDALLMDRRITRDEVTIIHEAIERDGPLDMEDLRFLVELLSDADEVCPEFDSLFFPALKEVILRDGKIGQDEQFYLLKMLYSDGCVRDAEKRFLNELLDEADEVSPEFEELCRTAFAAEPVGWSLGGR